METNPNIVIGPNQRMRAIFEYVALIGPGMGSVLVTGESGTGKEVVANALHQHSTRRQKPFVAVSCALFADTLIESELFGHERGAFTGAIAARPGRFERAEGGTLFLDDIDDVPLNMQVKLLRALQNRTIERLGGTRSIPIDVRVVAGTKRDLQQMVKEGKFREDLYYRLNVLSLTLPPLRERRDDLSALAEHFLSKFFARRNEPMPPISDGVMMALQSYDWPGNVRELENTCERIAESCSCGHVRVGCLGASVLFPSTDGEYSDAPAAANESLADVVPSAAARPVASEVRSLPNVSAHSYADLPLDERLLRIEAEIIGAVLAETRGNKSKAAIRLGIKRSTLGDRIGRCGELLNGQLVS
ncbi:MAG: sigma-54-dependent Fis family transcriptional regulator [Acidobacteria bacterium]|jgi:DNA-binding NtrC family response regulator|nr:sigma-54-dependent Fis family transcriptional regulator [Acidobacteriota bacterium]MBP8272864.1 sigma-54-dependent Fis family transcriptional regulator [Acidobacteriota bacterium]